MKVTSFLAIATFCAASASAFGLHGASSLAKAASRSRGLAQKPMVQAVDIQGNRMDQATFVSYIVRTIDFLSV